VTNPARTRSHLLRAGPAVLLLAVACAAGCAAPPPPRLSPPITLDQLDVSRYSDAPCTLLRPDRAARRHLTPPGTPTTDAATDAATRGPGCRWAPTGPDYPTITAGASTTEGLEDVYRKRASYSHFAPTDIAHYPAAELSTAPGGPRGGRCTVRIGVADHSTVTVTAGYPPSADSPFAADPCGDADTVAIEVMGQLLAGSP
jgi:Protein of unknown function (DUF3558)